MTAESAFKAQAEAVNKTAERMGTDSLFNIRVKVKYQYGQKRVYINSFQFAPLKALTGRETLTETDIKALKSLGYSFTVENQEEV